jgi:hypothetical protein
MNYKFKKSGIYITFILLVLLHGNISAQTYVKVNANNSNILITGARHLTKTADSVVINRHSADFFPLTTGYFLQPRARTQTGVVVSFKTTSPLITVNFKKRSDAEYRELTFAVYKNKQFNGYITNTYQLNLSSGTTDTVTWEIVLPILHGVHFTGIELESGHTLLEPTIENKKKYIAIGNSITHGTGQTNAASDATYAYLFAKAMNWELYNLAVGGSRIHEQIAEETKGLDVHAISILWGYNDWIQGREIVASVMPRYRLLLTNLRKYHPNAYIYCIMPTYTTSLKPNSGNDAPIDTLRNTERRVVRELITQGDNRLVIVEGGNINNSSDLSDPVHLNNQGARKLSDYLISTARNKEIEGSQVYQLPFQELFLGASTANVYTTEVLNASLGTKGWEIGQPITRTSPSTTSNGIAFKTLSEGGYLLTPEIDVQSGTSLEINIIGRLLLNDILTPDRNQNNLQRNFFVVIGNDTVYDHHKMSYNVAAPLFQNPIRWMASYIYEGQSPIRAKLFSTNTYEGVWQDLLDGMIIQSRPDIANNTGLLVRQTDTVPALNIALGHTIDLGSININDNQQGTIVNKSFLLKGVNLVGSVDLSDAEAGSISVPAKSYIPVQGSINEQVPVQITVPAALGNYKEKVTLVADGNRANNTTNVLIRPTRTIWFTYTLKDGVSGLKKKENDSLKISSENGILKIHSVIPKDISVFTISGVLLFHGSRISQKEITLPKGIYIVKSDTDMFKIVL